MLYTNTYIDFFLFKMLILLVLAVEFVFAFNYKLLHGQTLLLA